VRIITFSLIYVLISAIVAHIVLTVYASAAITFSLIYVLISAIVAHIVLTVYASAAINYSYKSKYILRIVLAHEPYEGHLNYLDALSLILAEN
jgi:hypothetical protein